MENQYQNHRRYFSPTCADLSILPKNITNYFDLDFETEKTSPNPDVVTKEIDCVGNSLHGWMDGWMDGLLDWYIFLAGPKHCHRPAQPFPRTACTTTFTTVSSSSSSSSSTTCYHYHQPGRPPTLTTRQAFLRVAEICIGKLSYPEDVLEMTSSEREDADNTRVHVREVILDCAMVLGASPILERAACLPACLPACCQYGFSPDHFEFCCSLKAATYQSFCVQQEPQQCTS